MAETLYTIVNVLVLPPWLLLIVAPRWKWTLPVTGVVYPCLLGLAYISLFAGNMQAMASGFATLDNLARLFENPQLLLMGWVHYLAFDLFIGSWQLRDARRLCMPHALVVPCLLLTLFLGPTGLVCYFALRWTHRSRFEIDANRKSELTPDRTSLSRLQQPCSACS